MKQSFTVRHGALDGVEAFLSVARHRSFRRAADELGVTTSAVSQAIRALEARIGVALFIRTTRSVGLTEAGERFHTRARPAFEELVSASEAARQLADKPSGLLRLTVPRSVVPIVLEPIVASFCCAYPEVQVEVVASEALVDLAAEGFDAGVRMGQFIAPDMVTVRLSPPFRLVVVCNPSYLAGRVAPDSGSTDQPRVPSLAPLRRRNRAVDIRRPWSCDRGRRQRTLYCERFSDADQRCDCRNRLGASARTGSRAINSRRQVAARARTLCAADSGRLPLSSRPAPGHAEAASLHRAR